METLVRYSFTVYLRKTRPEWNLFGNTLTSAIPGFDVAITLFAEGFEDAIKKIPYEYKKWDLIKIDYPVGLPRFQHWTNAKMYTGHNTLKLVQ